MIDSNLGGTIGLDWVNYRHEDGAGDVDGSHFFQQYSLLYQSKGIINSGRAGNWDVALGYEWNDLNSELDDVDYDESTSKLLYRGKFLFAPGGLPLRIHAYSYDMQQSVPQTQGRGGDFGALIDPGIFTTIYNGQHISSGITLLAGIKNGSYLGEYREMLSKFPKLLIDFREDFVRDTSSNNPVHYRNRDLAFVSLNKKDNWFHYRHREFEDYEDSTNDQVEKTVLLGTIDHLDRRQWIHLTNWIKISTDISLTQYEAAANAWEHEDTYLFNLFSSARRKGNEVSNFANFQRYKSDYEVEDSVSLPTFARGVIDSQSSWRLMLLADRTQSNVFGPLGIDRREETVYGKYQLETTRYAGYTFIPAIELESSSTKEDDGVGARVGFELRTDNRYKKPYDWFVQYSLTWIDGEGAEDQDISYWGHELTAAFERSAGSRTKFGAIQYFLVGSGENDYHVTEHITQKQLKLSGTSDALFDDEEDVTLFGSRSLLYLELYGKKRLTNRFEAAFDYNREGSESEHLMRLNHILTSYLPKSYLRITNTFLDGEDVGSDLNLNQLPELDALVKGADRRFSHRTSLTYSPNRTWETRTEVGGEWLDGNQDNAWGVNVEQTTRYSLYQSGGQLRKILEAYNSLDFEHIWGPASGWYGMLELGVDWSPYRRILVGGNVTLEYWDMYDQTEIGYEIYAAVDFQKLRAKTAYEYRQLDYDDDSSTPKVKDSRVSVSVQKIF